MTWNVPVLVDSGIQQGWLFSLIIAQSHNTTTASSSHVPPPQLAGGSKGRCKLSAIKTDNLSTHCQAIGSIRAVQSNREQGFGYLCMESLPGSGHEYQGIAVVSARVWL